MYYITRTGTDCSKLIITIIMDKNAFNDNLMILWRRTMKKRKYISVLVSICIIVALLPAFAIPSRAANASAKYKDVDQSAWYVPYIDYVVEHGLMTGNSSTSFAPNGTVTRAQYIQTLYALAKKPSVKATTKFTDLKKGAYYIDAVSWAAENKVTGGMTPTTFGPIIAITREQAATFF